MRVARILFFAGLDRLIHSWAYLQSLIDAEPEHRQSRKWSVGFIPFSIDRKRVHLLLADRHFHGLRAR